jgi:hypothetical protein
MIEAKLKLLLQMSLILIWGMDTYHLSLRERELIIAYRCQQARHSYRTYCGTVRQVGLTHSRESRLSDPNIPFQATIQPN